VQSGKAILAFCCLAHRTVRCRFPSLFGEADRWQPWSRWRTGHCLVPPTSRCLGHVSRADRATARWPGRPLAHRTVRCTPDSPVSFSRTPLISSREQQVRLSQPGAPDTVGCTTGQSGATRQNWLWLNKAISLKFDFSCFQHLDTIH
jgi:hypothetical protein